MYREPKQDLFFVLIISALLHILFLIFFLLYKINFSSKKQDLKKTTPPAAKVIFKAPPKKPQKPKQVKRYVPKLTSGAAGFAQPVPTDQSEKKVHDKKEKESVSAKAPSDRLKPEKTDEKPAEKPSDTPKPKEPVEKKSERPKMKAKKKTQALVKKVETTKHIEKPEDLKESVSALRAPSDRHKPEEKKQPVEKFSSPARKLTLADVTKNIFQYAQQNQVRRPSGMNHLVNITGNNFGKTTAEQLRYERYASKLLESMRMSLIILLRKFRFIKKPKTDVLQFQFTMDVAQNGQLAALRVDKPTGYPQFDQLMVKMIQHAAQTFPPLPAFLKAYDACAFPVNYVVPVKYIQSANLHA